MPSFESKKMKIMIRKSTRENNDFLLCIARIRSISFRFNSIQSCIPSSFLCSSHLVAVNVTYVRLCGIYCALSFSYTPRENECRTYAIFVS